MATTIGITGILYPGGRRITLELDYISISCQQVQLQTSVFDIPLDVRISNVFNMLIPTKVKYALSDPVLLSQVRCMIWSNLNSTDRKSLKQVCKQFAFEVNCIVGVNALLTGSESPNFFDVSFTTKFPFMKRKTPGI